jgi:hypothetical protein
MQFANESELQGFISSALDHLGHENMREVFTESGKGRIDILSAQYAIEVKPKLTALVTGRFNLRSDPTNANIVGTVNPGDVVGLTGRSTGNQYGNWVEIQTASGTRAWVASPALKQN